MSDYRIFETQQFQKDLKKLAPHRESQIQAKLNKYCYPQLKKEPHFGPNIKRLKGWEPPTWRYRIGDWRFFYEIDEKERIVFLLTVEHRREAYR
ncbi:MAG: hypothetical protein A2W61_05405 [Deltaproteobacteria bacterium RIFCSPLOWO2_01_44_7]|nr:MAG: hypothetical protein A2712_10895 [Deltaproteobacteria bacterium RIFCSPHIGHO2_01_FULL_43_49]OGQ16561.1 MAG: hypothetical protein A3D22_06595 [Deltaproteobacteria bacterium RIFCSPHIGHO2_02_FULL_44_53]OGQ28377.1 MAG: hypothetical protein A3D98_06300 [Deltaproteobacteria bacterium RIFCSPHIGHO2_12_FULL_44_21]OGQ32449.1 MAG: hypothetical protein A2979_10860 [Deltaproteobacteria bacterium RIFCSPLOWO2_01_FULL_45_74]OGQ38121.1 MAG: hypothetical protein A2W61_05405 [Deltaproteobacteria bacterium 